MAWNEPGNGKDQDPWGNRKRQDGPPDLDEIVRKMQDKFGGMFGKKGSGGRKSGPAASIGVGVLLVVALVIWGLSGIYILDEAERGVVLRFGNYVGSTCPGPHWHIPYPVEQVEKVNVKQVRSINHKAQMLTSDQNLIRIDLGVQFQVRDATEYLFNVRDPDYTLKEATESALREVVGSKAMDDILNPGGREVLVLETHQKLQQIVDLYSTGLLVIKVNLDGTQPPEEVQDAFQDAIKAQEDEVRFRNQAEAYARDIIPRAEGEAQRLEQEAEAYRKQVTEQASGETSRFLQILAEYSKAPEVTRRRLYLETMEAVLSNSSKVMIKVKEGNSIMYLPLDQMLQRRDQGAAAATGAESGQFSSSTQQPRPFNRVDGLRDRGDR